MATINPYAGDVIQFPAGTPASVISAYYNAIIRNQNVEAAQVPWYQQAVHGVADEFVNPYLKQVINEPFLDYRQEFNTNQNIRQAREVGNDTMSREQEMLRFKDEMMNEDVSRLGKAAGDWAQIANTPGASTTSETTTGGGVNPYGEFEDPWSTGTFNPDAATQPRPTSSTVTDEMGTREEERGPEDISMPADSGQANIFTATPGKKPSSAEIIAQMAAKYPTLNIGQLLTFLGPATTGGMLDTNKVEAAQAEIARKEAATAKDREYNRREGELLEGKKALQAAQTGKNVAQTGQIGAQEERLRSLAQSEQGRQTIRQYVMDHPELSEEEAQKLLALASNQQVRETPGQVRDRSDSAATIRANAPKAGKTPSATEQAKQLWLDLEARKATLTPDEENRRAALEKIYGKQEDPIKAAIRNALNPGGANNPTPAEPSGTPTVSTGKAAPPAGVPKNYVQAVTLDGRTVWVDPKNYDKKKYTLR